MKVKCVVACFNSYGEPDFCPCIVECTRKQHEAKEHITTAEDYARESGYEDEMIVFENHWLFNQFDWSIQDVVVVGLIA